MKISNKKLINLVNNGIKPVVRITKESTIPDLECCFNEGMIGQIEYVHVDYVNEDGSALYKFGIREDKFRDINKPVLDRNFYDSERVPRLTYIEAGYFSENGIDDVFVMDTAGEQDPADFEIVEVDTYHKYLLEFLDSGKSSYIKFLEYKIEKLTANK